MSDLLHRSFKKQLLLQSELMSTEGRFKAIFDQAAVGIAMVDTSGNWLMVNDALCELLGYNRDQLLTKNFQQLTYPPDLDLDLNEMQRLLKGEISTYELEKRYIRKGGDLIWAMITISLVRKIDNSPDYFISIIQNINQRKLAEALLVVQGNDLKQAQDIAKIGKWEWDVVTDKHSWSDEIFKIYGRDLSLGPAQYPEVSKYFTKDSWIKLSESVETALKNNTPYTQDAEVVRPDGSHRWITATGEARVDSDGKVIYMHGTVQDITERKLVELRLQIWAEAFQHAGFSLAISDAVSNTFLAVNPTFAFERGYSEEELVGKSVLTVFPEEIHEEVKLILSEIDQVGHGIRESFHIRKDGSRFPVIIDLTVIRNAFGKVSTRLAYVIDISERKESEALIYKLSNFDSLTHLPNRGLFTHRLRQILSIGTLISKPWALVFINIDHFKTLNDARGHEFGDHLLVMISNRLGELLTEDDTLARMGGDEFGIILKPDFNMEINSPIINRVSRIFESLQIPFALENDEKVYITASMGVALFPENSHENAEDIIKRADTALLSSQTAGGNQVVFFETEMSKQLETKFYLNRELHNAVNLNQLRLFLQSQVDHHGKLVGAEALIRWQHPERGLLSPAEFIPIAETSDIIVELGDWALNQVCKLLEMKELAESKIRISLNISPRHFKQLDFLNWVQDTISRYEIDPSQLTFEVTENLIIDKIDDVYFKMESLSELGIRMSIDDFGTGYSSLSYLKKLPIQELKIDKLFIQDAPTDPDDAALVVTILTVAKQLGLEVVAEGVETQDQADFLNNLGEYVHQGYFYSKPMEINKWVSENIRN